MFVVPYLGNSGNVPCYADLVDMAEGVLRDAKGLGREWFASNAEVMAWSSRDNRGVLIPHRFRVTLDMVTKYTEVTTDCDIVLKWGKVTKDRNGRIKSMRLGAPIRCHSWDDFAKSVRRVARRVWRDWRDHDD